MTGGGDIGFVTRRPIAHRGLHDRSEGRIENALASFMAAAAKNYAIELDVQVSSDGHAMVFHDDTLERLTGETGRTDERTAAQLQKIVLTDGRGEAIAPLTEVLEAVAGRVPVIVEMKDNPSPALRASLANSVAEALIPYRGAAAAMSFSQDLIRGFHAAASGIPVGLTAEGTSERAFAEHRAIVDLPVRFISYNVLHLPNGFVAQMRSELKLPVITWTVRDTQTRALSEAHADQMTFEGFLP